MTDTNDVQLLEWLDQEVDGSLAEPERSLLEAALAADPDLRRSRDELIELHQVLEGCRIDVSADFQERVMAALPAAPWRRTPRRRWGLAVAASMMLALVASLLVGSATGGAGPLTGVFAAVGQMLQASALTGAGLLGASWQGVGLALGEILNVSPATMVAFGVVVAGVNLLFFRMLRRRVGAAQPASRGSSNPSDH